MSERNREDIALQDETEDKSEALRMCLQYLYREALEANLYTTAHLIGLAAESLQTHCERDLALRLASFRGGTRQ